MPIHSFNGSNAAQSTVFAKVIETHGAMDYCGSAGRMYRSATFWWRVRTAVGGMVAQSFRVDASGQPNGKGLLSKHYNVEMTRLLNLVQTDFVQSFE